MLLYPHSLNRIVIVVRLRLRRVRMSHNHGKISFDGDQYGVRAGNIGGGFCLFENYFWKL